MSDGPRPDWSGKRGFMRGMFSETDGTPSSSRVMTAVIASFALGWVTAIVIAHLMRRYEPVIPELGGLAAFTAALYGVNKITNVFQNRQ
jgi:hypothetical protein